MEYTGAIIVDNIARLVSDRSSFSTKLEKCKAYATPGKYGSQFDNRTDSNRQRQNQEVPAAIIIDHLAEANFIFSRGMFSNLCPPTVKWFSFGSREPQFKDFLTSAGQKYYDLLYASSNFATEINELIEDAGCAGTTALSVERDLRSVVRFKNHDIQSWYVEESQPGVKDIVYRIIPLTALQCVNKFSEESDTLPKKISDLGNAPENSKSGKVVEIIHFIAPNHNRTYDDDGNPHPGNKNMPYVSIYVEKETKTIIRRGGYQYNPYVVGCIDNPCNGIYSDSPMLRSLRTARSLNRAWTSYADATEAAVRPSVAVDAAGYNGLLPEFYFEPGTVNVYDSRGGTINPPQFYVPPANLPAGKDFIETLQRQVNLFHFTDLFTMITTMNRESGRQRTAYEIQQLVNEKNNMMMPIVARFLDTTLSPALRLGFFIALEAGALGDPPDGFMHSSPEDIKIEYFSPLALAAQKSKISGTFAAIQEVMPLQQLDPSQGVFDIFNFDKIIRDAALASGAMPDHLRSEPEIKKIRADRAEAARQAQQAELMAKVAASQDLTKPAADSTLAGSLVGGGR